MRLVLRTSKRLGIHARAAEPDCGSVEVRKDLIDRIQQNKVDIEQLNFDAERAEREGDYARVAEIRYGTIKQKKTRM